MGRMRRLQPPAELGFIVSLGRLTLLELPSGLGVTEVGSGPARELLLPIADDLVLVRDPAQSAQQHGDDDEDRPEEDDLPRDDR